MNTGNIQIQAGGRFDTGRKFIGTDGVARPVYRKQLLIDALANAGAKNVAHTEAIRLNTGSSYARVVGMSISNGTLVKTEGSIGVTIDISATNVVITSTTDLTLYVNGIVEIDFCL